MLKIWGRLWLISKYQNIEVLRRLGRVTSETLFVMIMPDKIHAIFYKESFLSTRLQCCLTFSWVEFQLLLKCFLIHISIVIPKHFLYLCPCLNLGLFMPCLCGLFFIFIFIMINRINTDTLVISQNTSYYFWMITWIKNVNNFQMAKVQPPGVA